MDKVVSIDGVIKKPGSYTLSSNTNKDLILEDWGCNRKCLSV